jgi:hypothetical protein
LRRSVPDAQLAVIIISPAPEAAARYYRAGVVYPRGDGGGGDACRVRVCACTGLTLVRFVMFLVKLAYGSLRSF